MKRKLVLIIALTLLVGMLSVAFNVQRAKATGTIYIRADGSIDPPTAKISSLDNVTYTFTGDINNSIVVQRSDIVIDGQGYTLQGSATFGSTGITASGALDNVTIENMTIKGFGIAISMDWVQHAYVIGNKIMENRYGIVFSRWYCTISQNNIANNSLCGISIISPCYGVNVVGNNVTSNNDGIEIFADYVTVSENNITVNFRNGVSLISASGSNIIENRISDNGNCGIFLYSSSDCRISANTIANNGASASGAGIWMEHSSSNTIYGNNFLQNHINDYAWRSYLNNWDSGQALGGNYWSNYAGADIDEDGIGDTPYVLDEDNVDNFPLMVKAYPSVFVSHLAQKYEISVMSNSSISNLQCNVESYVSAAVTFHVSEENGTQGFCRIVIPKAVINGTYEVKLDGLVITYPQVRELLCTNEQYVVLYINYTHREHTITITGPTKIPEFSSFFILPLFMIATLIAVIAYRRRKVRCEAKISRTS